MSEKEQGIYEFNGFQLDIGKGVLLREGHPVSLQWKTFELLCVLVKSNGNLITRNELMNKLWADTFVEENNLSQHIRSLRKALGDGEKGSVFIETVPRRGYRFLPNIRIVEPTDRVLSISQKHNQNANVENISDNSGTELVTNVPLNAFSNFSDSRTDAKIIAFPFPENCIENISENEFVAEDTSFVRLANKQDISNQPSISKRRLGSRRALKILVWGLGIGFGFLILFQVIQIFTVMVYGTTKIPKELQEMLGTLIGMLSIAVGLGYAFGIGLFLFGIFRLIYAIFEKEHSKNKTLLIEKLIAFLVIGIIAAVAIPNLLHSYRRAKEFQNPETNTSIPNNFGSKW